jgi:hypothetical protein
MAIPTAYRVDADEVAWRVTDGEAVLLHADSSAYFGLNRTGTLLWERITEHPVTLEQLEAWARATFFATPDRLTAELSGFLEGLGAMGLLYREEASAIEPSAESRSPGSASWEPPTIERFGELEKLILSGE